MSDSHPPTRPEITDRLPDPEQPLFPVGPTGADFDRLPLSLRRWSASTLWRRIRMPYRTAKRSRRNARRIAPFAKADLTAPPTPGAALILTNLGGKMGLSRGALYDIQQHILPHHTDVTYIDIGKAGAACLPEGWDPGKRFTHVYLHGMPILFTRVWSLIDPAQIRDAWRIGIWVWETDNFPPTFRHALSFVHEIWSPSAFAADAFRKGAGPGISVSVKRHGVAVDPSLPALPRARFGVAPDAFLGVAIMDLHSCPHRKNPWAHVEAWQKAFGGNPAATLLIKLRSSDRTAIVLRELREMIGDAPNVRIVDDWFTAEEISGFQKMADVYLSLHRSEGYGLNIHECLLHGVPVVATHWSANVEYGPDYPHYHPVPATLVPYRGDWLLHYPGEAFRWAEPDTDEAARILRRIARGASTHSCADGARVAV